MTRKTTVHFYEGGKKRIMTNVYKKEFYVGGEKIEVGILSTNPEETWLINELDNILCEKCENINGQLILNNEFFSLAVRKVKEILNYQNEKADNEENPVYYKFYRDGYNGAIWMV